MSNHIVEAEMLANIQAAYDAGNLPDNKFHIKYNYDIIVGEGQYQIFYELVEQCAIAMEKDPQAILSSMYACTNFQDVLAIFDYEFGSRIELTSGAENIVV